jgi:hypothetical protein
MNEAGIGLRLDPCPRRRFTFAARIEIPTYWEKLVKPSVLQRLLGMTQRMQDIAAGIS